MRPRVGRSPNRSPGKKPRARGTPRVLMDPRASTPRDIEACRSPNFRKSAKTQGVPRAVFLGLLRTVPGGRPFVTFNPIAGAMTLHRFSPGTRPAMFDASARPTGRQRASTASGGQDQCGLDRRAVASHLRHHVIPRPPLPVSCLKMLDQTPLGNETGCAHHKCALRGEDKFCTCLEFSGVFAPQAGISHLRAACFSSSSTCGSMRAMTME